MKYNIGKKIVRKIYNLLSNISYINVKIYNDLSYVSTIVYVRFSLHYFINTTGEQIFIHTISHI